jgi:hypothetical protein
MAGILQDTQEVLQAKSVGFPDAKERDNLNPQPQATMQVQLTDSGYSSVNVSPYPSVIASLLSR